MKKQIVIFGIVAMVYSCGNNKNELEAQKKIEADSIKEVETLLLGDSIIKKKRVQWVLNDLIAMRNPPTINKKILEKYTGTFDKGYQFYMKDDRLFCKNNSLGSANNTKDAIFKLYPINDSLFELDQTFQIEFVKDEEGKYATLKLHLVNGHTQELNRMLDRVN